MNRAALVAVVAVGAACAVARAQTTFVRTGQHLTLDPWEAGAFGDTYDRLLLQRGGHIKDADPSLDDDTHVFFWDSTGRFRFSKQNDRAPSIAYRWATLSFDNESRQIPDHLDDVDLVGGLHLGELFGGDLGLVGGAGYSGNSPFGNSHGWYGIGHVTWQRPLSDADSIAITVDYDGNRTLLPDAPLPGFAWIHRGDNLRWGVGFPDSWIAARITPEIEVSAEYAAPLTGNARVAYHLNRHVSVFGAYNNFFNGFAFDDQPVTNRIFFQMSSADLGVRFDGKIAGFDVDAAITFGYAFEQNFYGGDDARNLDRINSISDQPYIGLVVVGKL